jgi:putative membrane protein
VTTPPLGVVAGLIALQAVYLLCVGRFRDRIPGAQPVSTARQLVFAEGVAVLLVALASPLHDLSEQYLFSAHMVQHLLVTLVGAPLLLAGTPGWLLRELLTSTRLLGVARAARHPLIAFGLFNLVFSIAHVPALYELSLASEPLHAAEHLVFLVTALLMWLPILSPLPEELPRYPGLGQVLYLFVQTIPSGLVGALLSASGTAFYATYVMAPRITGLSPREDQQLGGLIMWVGTGLYFLIASAVVFFSWASREEATNRRPLRAV